MSQFRLITVGRPRDKRLLGLTEEYMKRLSPLGVVWEVVAEEPFKKGQEAHTLAREQERLLARISPQEVMVLLDIGGEMVDSPALARRLEGWRRDGRPVVWVVGGSLGVGEGVRARAQWRWSLSPLTLPHSLAQVVVTEQIYRAWTIIQSHPYHK